MAPLKSAPATLLELVTMAVERDTVDGEQHSAVIYDSCYPR